MQVGTWQDLDLICYSIEKIQLSGYTESNVTVTTLSGLLRDRLHLFVLFCNASVRSNN
ncbi:hypothetical protein SAMN05443144_108106 [Fodinibius roseus]|uniref:Uncharacterized protein n=1 Tax=Fodinibius roseus TaxID=1194090 RepID=A0A1M5BFJ2_9BACT|nr:hypothetical protein SAMN05443144_108106 [Fodinibius roseus]